MSGSPESDEHAFNHLLADLAHPHNSTLSPTWVFPPTPSSTQTGSTVGITTAATPFPRLPRRVSSREHTSTVSVPGLDLATPLASAQQSTFFNTPSRSIFSSGPPTSSVSANTAQASLSAPSNKNSSLPLSTLTVPGSNTPRRSVHYQIDHSASSSRASRIPRAEKDIDDPSRVMEDPNGTDRRGTNTPTALSRLFTAPDATTPVVSRNASYFRTTSGTQYTRSTSSETASLPMHLYNQGLLSGKHSDITVHAFGTKYPLHRLLLDRAPFFSSALSEPWFESTSKDITLHPEDIDSSITQQAFELALKRIYGCDQVLEEEKEAVGLFATGCWLEMADLVDASVTSLLHQMCPSKLSSMIRLVTNNYYGKPGERILSSAKAMLCREGWEMPIRHWDGIPGDIAREIIGGDGLFVPGEWERWVLAKRVLDRRLRMQAHQLGLIDQNGKAKQAPPASMYFSAIRFDTVYQRDSFSGPRGISEADDPWIVLYTCPDVAALLVLLDEGIHYVHLSFEQLQTIREQRDALGVPILPEKVISCALWMSLELRQKIVNAKDLDMELGLSQFPEDQSDDDATVEQGTATGPSSSTNATPNSAGKQPEPSSSPAEDDKEDDEMESGSWDGNGKPRKFWIPNADATSVMGGVQEELPCSSNGGRAYAGRHVSRLSATIDPHDVQWASDFTAAGHERPQTPNRQPIIDQLPPLAYTHYPPFRFSAEFPNVRLLKDKKRVYSRTVWYAGSLWNVYVQKVETPKNTQLGVYLHRAKEREASEDIVVARHGSVDESIGHLERELLLGRRDRSRHRRQVNNTALDIDEDNSGSGGDPDATLVPGSSTDAQRATVLNGLLRGQGITKASQTPGSLMLSNLPDRNYTTTPETDEDVSETTQNMHLKVPALSPYVDGRPTIRTYFKIYTPSKGGRVLSVYESAPDTFNFSQSWGWKSSNMVLDDGMLGFDETARSKDGRLRFMVVIGNV